MHFFAGAVLLAILVILILVEWWTRRKTTNGKERFYRKKAKKNCWRCKGVGMVKYFWNINEATIAPCYICFPYDLWANRERKKWKRERKRQGLNIP